MLIVFFILFGGGLGLVLATGQIASKRHGDSRYVSALLMASTGLWQIYAGLLYAGVLDTYPHLRMTQVSIAFCVAPSLYLYLRALTTSDGVKALGRPATFLKHYAIVPVSLALLLPVYLSDGAYKIALENHAHHLLAFVVDGRAATLPETLGALLLIGPKFSVLFYLILIALYLFRLPSSSDALHGKPGRTLLLWLVAVIAVSDFLALLDHFVSGDSYLKLGAVMATACIYLLYLLGRVYGPEESGRSGGRYERSRLRGVSFQDLRSRLARILEEEKLYADEDMTLGRLAAELSREGEGLRPAQLSEFINREYGKNFNQYINEYRVREAARILETEPERSVLSVAMAVGFNSKSAFNKTFKEQMNTTPGKYRDRGRVSQ